MVGGTAGDGHQKGRILGAQRRASGGKCRGRAVEQSRGGLGNLVDLAPHIGLHRQVLS
ncbi:hypothetical protein ABIA25_003471 [Sinorhizobium fredii]